MAQRSIFEHFGVSKLAGNCFCSIARSIARSIDRSIARSIARSLGNREELGSMEKYAVTAKLGTYLYPKLVTVTKIGYNLVASGPRCMEHTVWYMKHVLGPQNMSLAKRACSWSTKVHRIIHGPSDMCNGL